MGQGQGDDRGRGCKSELHGIILYDLSKMKQFWQRGFLYSWSKAERIDMVEVSETKRHVVRVRKSHARVCVQRKEVSCTNERRKVEYIRKGAGTHYSIG